MGDFRDDILSFGATPWLKSLGMSEGAARKIASVGRPPPDVRLSTSRQPAPTILAHSERLFSAFMDHLPCYAWIKDADGSYVYVNERVKQLPPFQEDFLGKTDADLWPSDLAAEYRGNDLKVIETRQTLETVESCVINGEQHCLLVSRFPMFDESGAVLMVGGTSVDITEHQQAEHALNASQRYLQALFDNSLDAILVTNDEGRYIDANPAACAQLGYTHDELVQLSILDLTAEAFREEGRAMREQCLARGSNSGEYSALRKDGTVIQVEFRAVANILPGVHVASSRDITERKRAEQQLRASGAQLAEAQRIAHVGSWSGDLDSETQFWSDELYRIYGLQPGQITPTYEAFLEIVHPEDRLHLGESVEHAIRLREPIDLYFRIIRPDGEERIIHLRGRIVYDDQEIPIRRFGTAQDVTEYRSAAAAQRAAEQKYRDIFENAVEGIFQSTPDGRFISANPALVKMFGFSSAAELVRERTDISHQHYVDPQRREEFKRQLAEQGVVREFEFQAYRKDGTKIWLSENVRAVRDEGGEVLYYEGTAWDITERRQADHSLRLFRSLIDRSTDAIEVIDPATQRFLDCNKSACQDLGYSRDEFLSLSVYDIDPLIDENRAEWINGELNRSGFVVFESIHRRKDGSTFPVEVNLRTVDLERNYRLAVVRDITERKRAETALRESEERYRELFENAKDAFYVHDLGGRYTSVNRAAEKLSGHSRMEIIGRSFTDFIVPDQLEIIREHLCRKLVEEGETTYETEVLARDGHRVPVEVSSHLIYENGIGVGVQGTARDISERKRSESALRESEERFAKAFHASPAALSVTLLEDGKLLEVNGAFLRMTGYERAEVIGKSTLELGLWRDADQRITMAGLLRERGAVADLEFIFRKKSGEERSGLLSVDLIELSGKPCVLGIAQDITERKRAEAALRNYSHLLMKAQEAERQRIARELHDQVGQVLTAIRINLQNIRNSTATAESISLIDEGTGMVDQALEQVRDLSFELRPSLLDDLGLAAALRWYVDRYAQRTGIDARTSISPESGIRLPRELETACFRIVQEALTNVARHSHAKTVSIDVSTMNGALSLSIRDDGVGFNPDSLTDGRSSNRLGLRGMEERAQGLGGRLEINSDPSKGTEVRVHFPSGSERKELA